MRKILFAGVSALALFAGAAFAQSSNDSTIDQVGTLNNVTVDQAESVSGARLVNRSVVDQGLANPASSHNTADIKQKDSGTPPIRAVTNDSTVIQNGTWNDATVKQTGDVDDNAPLKPALNTVNINQTGNGTKKKERNIAFVSQNSDDGPVGNNSTTSASTMPTRSTWIGMPGVD